MTIEGDWTLKLPQNNFLGPRYAIIAGIYFGILQVMLSRFPGPWFLAVGISGISQSPPQAVTYERTGLAASQDGNAHTVVAISRSCVPAATIGC